MHVARLIQPERLKELTQVKDIRCARTIMEAVEKKRAALRKRIDSGEQKVNPEQLHECLEFRLGMISMATWILELPDRARERIKNLPEGELVK